MRVYTYCDPLSDLDAALNLWKENWERFGWEPIILNNNVAKLHYGYRDYMDVVGKIPTVNMRSYEDACYARYMAIQFEGGGLLVDYDVVNLGFFPDDLPSLKFCDIWLMDRFKIPCVTYGTDRAFDKLALHFQQIGKSGRFHKRHNSDQTFIDKLDIPVWERCCFYGEVDWKQMPLVHISNNKRILLMGSKVSKADAFRRVIEESVK